MEAITYTKLRANLASVMDRVVADHDAVIVTRNSEPGVVILSLEDYEAMMETAHLLRSPRNAKRLLAAIDQLDQGRGRSRPLRELQGLADAD